MQNNYKTSVTVTAHTEKKDKLVSRLSLLNFDFIVVQEKITINIKQREDLNFLAPELVDYI